MGIGAIKDFFHLCIVINKYIKYQKVFNSLALLLVMLFAVQIASNALFYHTHTIDGKVYSHAHPGCDGHSHNAADFSFYQQLQTINAEDTPNLLADILPVYKQSYDIEGKALFQAFHAKIFAGRAPPVA